jgi:hypothetical protein
MIELPPFFRSCLSTSKWYALRTINSLEVVPTSMPDPLIRLIVFVRGMLQIISASSAIKMLWIRPLFHSGGLPVIRSSTCAFSGIVLQGDIIEKVLGLGIHLSDQTATDFPSPILHISLASKSSLPAKILRHAKEGLLPNFAVRKSPFRKYFPLIRLTFTCGLKPILELLLYWLKCLRIKDINKFELEVGSCLFR